MLQIKDGRLFTKAVSHENTLRGVIYTNAALGEDAIDTAFGRIVQTSALVRSPSAVLYEFKERIESTAPAPQVLLSNCGEAYLPDFTVVFGFALNCICAADIDFARRLTSGERGVATRVAPNKLVRRVFEKELWIQPDDAQFLVDFSQRLIGLHRKTYLTVMRAIRTYMTGMYRISDNVEIAYTLFVAAVETLAQDFDGHESDWDSYTENKRNAIDRALAEASSDVQERVRSAILSIEHSALGRRFREFAIAHVGPSFFRSGFNPSDDPIGRSELPQVLSAAYSARSEYVHQALQLPKALTIGSSYAETMIFGHEKMMTLQGLTRLMRHVIIEFVMRQPTIESEPYDYVRESSNVVVFNLAPQCWVGHVGVDIRSAGKKKLEGFLELLSYSLLKLPGAELADLRPLLTEVGKTISTFKREERLPYLALYLIFNSCATPEMTIDTSGTIERYIEDELSLQPSVVSMFIHALFKEKTPFPIEKDRQLLDDYFRSRKSKTGLRVHRLMESAAILSLAERYRVAQEFSSAREMIVLAVENYPGQEGLQSLEKTFADDIAIDWHSVLLQQVPNP
ncbi:hypothetical protein [Janthinobacterium sp. HLS12-2]|uniref:hypothetical protein n=1 Tax=Janthinobacterium sp. HLS12-2 TaxID=1259324 RepID=UPI003F27A7AE